MSKTTPPAAAPAIAPTGTLEPGVALALGLALAVGDVVADVDCDDETWNICAFNGLLSSAALRLAASHPSA